MAALLRYIGDVYRYAMEDLADPRMSDLPLVPSPWPTLFIIIFYNVLVTKIGPEFMKKRQTIDVKYPMILYNILQIVANTFFVIEAFRLVWIPGRYSVFCAEVDYSNDPVAVRIAFYTWLFFMTKLLDCLDTIFMVLRKKQRQVSFLHVYHHSGMMVAGWIASKYTPGGHAIFIGTINAFVHIVMYTYYLITALYPQYKENIWWKRHLTELQMNENPQFIQKILCSDESTFKKDGYINLNNLNDWHVENPHLMEFSFLLRLDRSQYRFKVNLWTGILNSKIIGPFELPENLNRVQFVILSLHGAITFCNPYCHFPKFLISIFVPQDIFMFLMFWDFYNKTYLMKKPDVNKNVKTD